MKKTILILGASSFVGFNLAKELRSDFRVVGTFHETPIYLDGVLAIPCDVMKKKIVEKVIHLIKPDITIYCVGMSSIVDCDRLPKTADALNTVGVLNASLITERINSLFCLISSAFVFSGDNFLFNEKDTPMSSTVYGSKMAAAEYYVQKSCLNYLILRVGRLFGRSYNPRELNWFEWMENKLFSGRTFYCDDTINLGFVYVGYLAEVIKKIFAKSIKNKLLQLSSKNYMTTYDFAHEYARSVNLSGDQIMKGVWHFPSNNTFSERAEHYKMHSSNLEKTISQKMLPVQKHIELFMQDYQKTVNAKNNSGSIQYI